MCSYLLLQQDGRQTRVVVVRVDTLKEKKKY